MNFYISRRRQQFGQYSEEDIRYGLAEGKFLGSDLGWQQGMEESRPLDELITPGDAPLPPRAPKSAIAPYVRKSGQKKSPTAEGISGFAMVAMLMGMISLIAYGFFLKTDIARDLFGQPDAFNQKTVFCYVGVFVYIMTFGHRALTHINNSQGKLRGKGMAMSGIFMGYFLFILLTPTTVAMALPAMENITGPTINLEGAARTRSKNKAQTLVTACIQYAVRNGGVFPENLEKLVDENYIKNKRGLIDPLSRNNPKSTYEYLGEGMKESDPDDAIVLRSQPKKNGRRVIARKNGFVSFAASP